MAPKQDPAAAARTKQAKKAAAASATQRTMGANLRKALMEREAVRERKQAEIKPFDEAVQLLREEYGALAEAFLRQAIREFSREVVARADQLRAQAADPNSIVPADAWIEMAEFSLENS
jgi:hypothetical protein